MEVRVQKKKNKFPIDGKKLHTVWKVLAVILSVCVLAGGIALWNRQEPALAGSFNMEKDSENRYIFNIVEVVPETNQAILGFYIQGKENISKQKLETLLQTSEFYKEYDYNKFFYWEGKGNSTQNEPFTVVQGANGSKTLVNNEVFKLFMLGIGTFDPQKSIWENYQANKAALETFDKEFVINYKVVTPSGLEAMTKSEKDKINYLHIASGNQITGAQQLFGKAGMEKPKTSDNFKANNDISWDTALNIYYLAISENVRMSVSISSAPFRQGTPTSSNMFRLYQMLNYADDPADFKNWFEDGTSTNENNFIDKNTGIIHENKNNHTDDWRVDNLNTLPRKDVGPNGGNFAWRAEDFIPPKWDNILIYRDDDQTGYLDFVAGRDNIEKILDFADNKPSGGGNPPEEPEDGTVKVLEIEPSNSYWLSGPGHLAKLATAIDVDEDDISVTYVTPNTLNGMTVDLVAEYDLILVGDDVSLFSNATGKSYSADRPYSNIGFYDDAVKTQTLLNGLLKDDYDTPEGFQTLIQNNSADAVFNLSGFIPTPSTSPYWNAGIRNQWGSGSSIYILKNIELYLQLGAPASSISSARFSGNDLSRYMQKELARYIKSGQPIVIRNKLREIAVARINDFNKTDLSKNGEKNELPENQTLSVHDARLYLALAGVEDEREYYDSGKSISTEYLESDSINVYAWESALEKDDGVIELKTQYKPQIQINDTGNKKDENGIPLPTIIEKGKPGEIKPDLSSISKDNSLTFNYEIMFPSGTNIKDCLMTVVVDRNGDGIFDEEGEGKTFIKEKQGKQNNATDTIQNDKVYQYKFSEKQEGTDYSVENGLIKGTFVSEGPVNAKEEICQFRVSVTAAPKSNDVLLKGVWTGYMRPALKIKNVKILQITPYEKGVGGKALSQNHQFIKWIQEAEKVGEEYHFDFANGYVEMSEDQFAQNCESGEITLKSLKEYDLIIAGTDFSTEASDKIIDTDRLKAGEVLKGYTEQLKRPLIMTNDSISYVNSANYVTPEERKYHYRYLTIAEGKELQRQGKLNSSNSELKKVKVYEEEYKGIEEKNKDIQDKDKGFEGEGTVYLDPTQVWVTEEASAGTYNALYLPVTQTMAKDGRNFKDYWIGYDLGWWLSDKIKVKVAAQDNNWVEVRASDFEQLLGNGFVYQPYWGILPLPSYYTKIGYVTEKELRNWYLKEPEKEDSIELRQITEKISIGSLKYQKYNFFYKDIHSKFRMEIPISEKVVDTENEIKIAGDTYYNFTDGSGKKYLATKSTEKVWKKYKEEWQIKEEIKSGQTADEVQYALAEVAGEKDALYPNKNNWNYFFTQSLRYIIGMDRFAVTTDLKKEEKRDSGSSRRWAKRTAIQGFTNAALLEYAYLPPEDAAWGNGVNTKSPYADPLLKLGTAPRTNRIEMLNEGTIGLYPFSITNENYSNQKIEIAKNHAPLYQLDLERETGEGKIDDVTVWFTFAGAGDGSSQQEKNESKYFDTTVRDARNNYYLYSKGKIYYTGFSLYDVTEGTESEDAQLVPDMEMKLFINTIYAALNSETEETTCYDTVVREGGTVSGIELAQDAGAPNRYTCYYDEYDETLELSFRVQKISAADGETTPLTIGKKGEKGENGLPAVNEFNETVYTLSGLPEENGVSNFPVVKIAGEQGTKGSMGSGASDIWYTLRFTWDKGEGKIPDDIDGMTMIIGPKTAETGALRQDCIYAEIRFVKRNLFELD